MRKCILEFLKILLFFLNLDIFEIKHEKSCLKNKIENKLE